MKTFNPIRLTQARLWNDFSLDYLAGLIHITGASINLYEKGKRKPDNEIQLKLANALDFPIDFFYTPSKDTSFCAISYRKKANTRKIGKQRAELLKQFSFEFIELLSSYVSFKESSLMPQDIEYDTLQNDDIEKIAQDVRQALHAGNAPIQNLMTFLENRGAFIFLYNNEITPVDGFSCINAEHPYIYINENASWDRMRFTLAHELGHIILHSGIDRDALTLSENNMLEEQADLFAAAFLIPQQSFIADFISPSRPFLLKMKETWGVSMAAIIMRAKRLGLITQAQKEYYFTEASRRNERKIECGNNLRPKEQPFIIETVIKSLLDNNVTDKYRLASATHLPHSILKILSFGTLADNQQEECNPFVLNFYPKEKSLTCG